MNYCKVAVLLCLSLSSAACGSAAAAHPSSGPSTTPSSSSSATDRTVAVYAAVIRRLVAQDATTGGAPAIGAVYVIDGAVNGAENPQQPLSAQKPQEAFKSAVKDGLKKALHNLPPLSFVGARSSVVTGELPGHVINRGILVTLGPIRGGEDAVQVGSSYWMNGLAGQWLTYEVRRRDDGWNVVGTTGPVAIS